MAETESYCFPFEHVETAQMKGKVDEQPRVDVRDCENLPSEEYTEPKSNELLLKHEEQKH